MSDMTTGRQIAAGRVLAGVGQERLARMANVPVAALRRMEATIAQPKLPPEQVTAVREALEKLGIRFIPENGGGVGVRLKFNASEVKRIATLEGEGGIVADDDI
jgi:hypothetical protein